MLYDECAEYQLTHGLVDGVEPEDRGFLQIQVERAFKKQLNPGISGCRWNPQQQIRLRTFIDVVASLKP